MSSSSDAETGSAETYAAADPEPTTTTLPTTTICKMEVSSWVDYVTSYGNSLLDAAGEYGMQSPAYLAVEHAWSVHAQNVYVVGSDDASQLAVKAIDSDCDDIGNSYDGGHAAPNEGG